MSENKSVDGSDPTDLDSTQKMRAITLPEFYDSRAPKWYVIQLLVSDSPFNPDLIPRLEVFTTHRLYTVVGKQGNATCYTLRLGFFPDEESAEVICGHLRTFFSSPSIVCISADEQARFAQPAASPGTVQQPR